MDLDNTKKLIRKFLLKFVGDVELDENEDLFHSGLVNSLFAMQLVMFVEKEFDIKINNDDLDIDNFNSIKSIAQYVSQKKK